MFLNSLGPSDAIWRQKSGSTLVQVMACCLTAPSHYLNQCWLIISKVSWHSFEGNFTAGISAINQCNWLKIYSSKISLKSPRPQWLYTQGQHNLFRLALNDKKTMHELHSQYHSCWWPGEARYRGINRHDIDIACLEYFMSHTRTADQTDSMKIYFSIFLHFTTIQYLISWSLPNYTQVTKNVCVCNIW